MAYGPISLYEYLCLGYILPLLVDPQLPFLLLIVKQKEVGLEGRETVQIQLLIWGSINWGQPNFFIYKMITATHLIEMWKWKEKVVQVCLTLCYLMDYTVRGILQARILAWAAFPFSRGSSQPTDPTQVSHTAGE